MPNRELYYNFYFLNVLLFLFIVFGIFFSYSQFNTKGCSRKFTWREVKKNYEMYFQWGNFEFKKNCD